MHITEKRTEIILNALQEKHYAEWCGHYGERGYQDPEKGIIFCNWNNVSRIIQDYLEDTGYSLEWSDEWYIDYNNDKAYRTSPDCYSWTSQIAFTDDGEVLTPDDSVDSWVDEMCMTDHAQLPKALPDWITENDLIELGYQAINGDYESGFHAGQTDDPKKIACQAFDNGAQKVVFRMKESSQFYIVFQGFALYEED